MAEQSTKGQNQQPEDTVRSLKLSIPARATVSTADGVQEYEGQIVELGDGRAQICLNHPVEPGTEMRVVVEFKDSRNREIRFRYNAIVTSPQCAPWYQVSINYEDGVGVSGKDAREILADLFPEEG